MNPVSAFERSPITRDTFDPRRDLAPGNLSLGLPPGRDATVEHPSGWEGEWFRREHDTDMVDWRAYLADRALRSITPANSSTSPNVTDFFSRIPERRATAAQDLLVYWLSTDLPSNGTWPQPVAITVRPDWSRWHLLRKKNEEGGLSHSEAAELLQLAEAAADADEAFRASQAEVIKRADQIHSRANDYLKRVTSLLEKIVDATPPSDPGATDAVH
jgi:hypothetical protein